LSEPALTGVTTCFGWSGVPVGVEVAKATLDVTDGVTVGVAAG